MLRTIFQALVIAGLVLVALLLALLVALHPPQPLTVPPQGVTLADVTVINPGSGRRAHQTIRVATSIVESISDYSTTTDTAPDARRYAGAYVLPGLIDMHVHHPLGRLPTDIKLFDLLHLAYGVTTVRDCGSIDGSVEQNIVHTPTIVVIQQLFRLQNHRALLQDPAARMLPRYYRELIWKPGGMAGWSVPALQPTAGVKMLQNFRSVVGRLHEAGVTVHVGTDTFNPFVVPGVSMHQELRNFVESGFTLEEAWDAATRGNGASLPEPGLGVIRPGAPADMLVFGEDPTHNLTALSTLQAVVANGRFYPKRLLDDTVARYRDYSSSWLYDRLTMLIFPWFAGSSQSEKR